MEGASGRAIAFLDGVVVQHEVPTIEAVLAAVGHDVARLPALRTGVFGVDVRCHEQVRPAAAIDARDHRIWFEHSSSVPRDRLLVNVDATIRTATS